MILFNGYHFAEVKEQALQARVAELKMQNIHPSIGAVLFDEDAGSVLYTRLKQEAAVRVGIGYQVVHFSLTDAIEKIAEQLQKWNVDPAITGIIIQKPTRTVWNDTWLAKQATPPLSFSKWWHQLTSLIAEKKDVDGLHPTTLAAIEKGTWRSEGRVLPATCRAVLSILDIAFSQITISPQLSQVAIVGRSALLGLPLYYELTHRRYEKVKLIGKDDFDHYVEEGSFLPQADIWVSSTGQKHLITGSLVKKGAIVIDAGEPSPDVERVSVSERAAFLTPVPGGVGPVTIVSLLENAFDLCYTPHS